jgi:hypothetical protein
MSEGPKKPGRTALPAAYAAVPTSEQPGDRDAKRQQRHQTAAAEAVTATPVSAVVHHVTATPAMVRFDGVDGDDDGSGEYSHPGGADPSAPFQYYDRDGSSGGNDLFCDKPFRTVDPGLYGHMPEARGLAWQDDFFDDDPEFSFGGSFGASPPSSSIVAVFDFDYDLMESYWEKVSFTSLGAIVLLLPHVAWIALVGMAPCYVRPNVRWSVRSQHVAVTRDGIAYVRDRRPTCWGQSCTDAGRATQTISFDHITDCSIVEPAGNTCLWIPNTLRTVHVDTSSSGGAGSSDGGKRHHELTLTGLKDPIAFKRLVWAMKRNYHHRHSHASSPSPAAPATTSIADRGAPADAAMDHPVVAELLREIRDELRRNNNGGGGAAGGEAAAPSSYGVGGDSEVPFVAGKPVA